MSLKNNTRKTDAIKLALSAYEKAINSCNPYNACLQHLKLEENLLLFNNKKYNIVSYNNIYVIGAGKAAYKMASAIYDLLGDKITDGAICVPQNSDLSDKYLGKIKIIFSSHPIPNEASAEGAKLIYKIANKANEKDLIIFLLSGGASSLMCLPAGKIKLAEKQFVNNLLLKSGANISEINIVRKHLSDIKGGKLAKIAYPATVFQLILSDVIGNSLAVIGSGPLIEDKYTNIDAINILNKYSIFEKVPNSLKKYLTNPLNNSFEKKEYIFEKINNTIIADNSLAIKAAAKELGGKNIKVFFYNKPILGEASVVSKDFFSYVIDLQKDIKETYAVIAGGEPVVTFNQQQINNSEKISGGRAQEFSLSLLKYLTNYNGRKVIFLTAGTDGIDGPTDAAGAIVTKETILKAENLGIDYRLYLENHNSFNFFSKLGGLIKTGYTGTNVNDLFIAIVQ